MKKSQQQMLIKRIIYTICFIGLVLIDWVRNNGNGQEWAIAINCIGFFVFLIIVLQYRIRDFVKLPYLIWYVVCIFAGTYALLWGRQNSLFFGQWVTAVVNVCLYGTLVIRMIFGIVNKEISIHWKNKMLMLTLLTFLALFISKNNSLWPLWFFVMFGCYYLTKFTTDDREVLFDSMLNGIILGFFILQGLAFVFRPYDQVRYVGMFVNSNANGLFYLVTYCAFLSKVIRERQKSNHGIIRLICLFFAGVTISFAFLTISRVVFATIIIITCIFLILEHFIYSATSWKGAMQTTVMLGSSFVVSFFMVFAAVRYLPPFFHHPIWFQGEYSEQKVHSWDKYDSDKFVDLDEFLDHAVYRTLITFGLMGQSYLIVEAAEEQEESVVLLETEPQVEILGIAETIGIAEISKMQSEVVVKEYKDGVSPGIDAAHPIVNVSSAAQFVESSFGIRGFIYSYYLQHLSMFGTESNDSGIWLFPDFYCFHAHNSFLQILYTHGIIAGFLFILWILTACYNLVGIIKKNKNQLKWYYSIPIFYFLVFILYGQLEIGSFIGQQIFTLLFLLNYLVVNKEGPCDVI